MKLKNLVVKKSINKVINKLNLYGIAIIKNYTTKKIIKDLNKNFDFFLKNQSEFISNKYIIDNKSGVEIVLDSKEVYKNFKSIRNVYQSNFLKNLLKNYFQPYNFKLNENLVLNLNKKSKKAILPWHVDRLQSLKFMLYLEKTSKLNGAFEYCPGTHWEGRYRASSHMLSGLPLRFLPNDVPKDRVLNPVTISVDPGDLIIFDPDGFHRGGIVKKGLRKVLRADSYPKPNRGWDDNFFSFYKLLTSPLNINRLLGKYSKRVLGYNTRDKFNNRGKIIRSKIN